jgi:hypothetical protein
MPTLLSVFGLSRFCTGLPIPYRIGFQQPLYAYVQVRFAPFNLDGRNQIHYFSKLSCNWFYQS